MGPITLVDKSLIQSLSFDEVRWLDRYYSLVISPILMRELLSNLAKEKSPKRDWEHILSTLAAKANTMNSYTPPNAYIMARQSLLGNQLPMDGRVPLEGGRQVRSRDGTYGVIFEESESRKILRDWESKNFTESYRANAELIRKVDHQIDLSALQKSISEQMSHYPDFDNLEKLVAWLDENYFAGATPDFHLKSMAYGLLSEREFASVMERWKAGKLSIDTFAPYAFYFYRVNSVYNVALGKGIISSSKGAKSHLDIQYIHYLPFAMCFTSSDNELLEVSKVFKRDDQLILPGSELKNDLQEVNRFFNTLNDRELQQHRKDFGIYPPELPNSLTAESWKTLMRPRPDPSIATPKMSPKQEKELVDRLNKYLTESVTVDSDGSTPKISREKKSIFKRNIDFVAGVFDILKLSDSSEWEGVKKEFSPDCVKSIYNIHADIWHPSDPFCDLAADVAGSSGTQALYIGDIEPIDLVDQVWRWSLHFDKILIPDPFHSPWTRKEEFNPIANPGQFENDTLKLAYGLILLQPLILSGQVLLIPDPGDYDPKLKNKMLTLAEKRKQDSLYKKMSKVEDERIKRVFMHTELRVIARLPEKQRLQAIKSKFGQERAEQAAEFLGRMRNNDPLCVDRDTLEGQVMISRSGANFDSSILLSSLYGSIPFSPITARKLEFDRASTSLPKNMEVFAKKMQNLPICKIIDPFFSAFAKEKGAVSSFRSGLSKVLSGEEISAIEVDELFNDLAEEADFLAEVISHETGIDGETLVDAVELSTTWSDKGFLTPSAIEYLDSYDPSLKTKAPNCFLGTPPSNLPLVPF